MVALLALAVLVAVAVIAESVLDESGAAESGAAGSDLAAAEPGPDDIAAADTDDGADAGPDLVGDEPVDGSARADGGCTIGALQLQYGSTGDGVTCLQEALAAAGLYAGSASGEYDQATVRAVTALQEERDLFVDGVAGRETAIALEIWPDEESLVVRTPPPSDGATDLWGVPLSPVASAGASAPPLPENSGSGYRVVYDRAGQRVWAVDDQERIVRSWLVSGSTYGNEMPGTHRVYSRSELSTAWNGKAYLPRMIRYQETELGNIGFHGIPTSVADGTAYQTTDELGTRLSGGCQRQHNTDAAFLWGFAPVGTTVVVT